VEQTSKAKITALLSLMHPSYFQKPAIEPPDHGKAKKKITGLALAPAILRRLLMHGSCW
jgi:hypothetical protein